MGHYRGGSLGDDVVASFGVLNSVPWASAWGFFMGEKGQPWRLLPDDQIIDEMFMAGVPAPWHETDLYSFGARA